MDNTNQYQYKLTKYRHLSKKNPNNPVYANKIQKYQTLLQVSQIQQGGDGLQKLDIDIPDFKKITSALKELNIDLNIAEAFNKFSKYISDLISPEKIGALSKLLSTPDPNPNLNK